MRIPYSSVDVRITIPDDSLSIKDILYRFSRGLPLDKVVREPIYDDDSDDNDEDFDVSIANEHLEFSEVAEAYQESVDVINSYNESLKQNENETTTDESTSSDSDSTPS